MRPRQSAELHRWKEPKSSTRSALFSGISVSRLSIWKEDFTLPSTRASRATSTREPSGEKPAHSTYPSTGSVAAGATVSSTHAPPSWWKTHSSVQLSSICTATVTAVPCAERRTEPGHTSP
ncbi:hypothetical protein KYC5002_13485 [Archangium violaceum]|uniref:hypothetical protein n=1 Tax=Archangium violaceum TaxID=83451 RepID=UPI002B31A46D|nr:hypothetical protein KYC5002_13485 [Archangium gephyra]